jgi:hypothetical protein
MHAEPFICGTSGEQDTGGLHNGYIICPMPGSDYVAMYSKMPWRLADKDLPLPIGEYTLCRFQRDSELVYQLFRIDHFMCELSKWELYGYELVATCDMSHICKPPGA